MERVLHIHDCSFCISAVDQHWAENWQLLFELPPGWKIGPNLQILSARLPGRAHNNSATSACTKLPWAPCSNLQISYLFWWAASRVHDQKEITHPWHLRKISQVFRPRRISSSCQHLSWILLWNSLGDGTTVLVFSTNPILRFLSSPLLGCADRRHLDCKDAWTTAIWTATFGFNWDTFTE